MKPAACFTAAFLVLFAPACAPASDAIRDRIAGDTRLFSIEVRDAVMSDVLRALADQSGFNIILGDGVDTRVTLSLKDIAYRDALEIILKAGGLTYTIQNNVFWVGRKVDSTPEMLTEVVRLNYADPAAVIGQLKGTLSADGAAMADQRLNAIILRDLPLNAGRAVNLIKSLDVQTAQVTIEARIVEANSSFSRQLGVQWGGRYTSGRDSITGSALLPQSSGGRSFAVNLPAINPTSGLGVVVGNFSSKVLLDAELSAAESKGELKIVSRPKISTVNNRPATIHSGLTFRVKLNQGVTISTGAVTTATGGTTTATGLQEIKTGIDLTVTPQISPDGFIMLNIVTNKSDPDFSHSVDGIPGVTEKSASTQVLVKDGDTVVLAGLYKTLSSSQDDAVPFLSRVPLIGFLFEHSAKGRQDEELIVFITPKIVKYDIKPEVSH